MVTVDLETVGGKRLSMDASRAATGDPNEEIWDFGWRGPGNLVEPISADHAGLLGQKLVNQTEFKIDGSWQLDKRRYALWNAGKKLFGKHLPYNRQITGSCVGAGGGNMAKTAICVEIMSGELEEYKELWWPYTYGRSRYRSGMTRPGEGSSGTGWAEAAVNDGLFAASESGLPAFTQTSGGWLQLTSSLEIKWSDGDSFEQHWHDLAHLHLFQTAARMRSKDDCIAALASGYAITQASNFGFRSSKVVGTPQVRIAPWDGSWSHMTYVDEFWDHPTESEIFRWGNNWDFDAHGPPTGDEPPGGVYIRAATMDAICKRGEVFAFSAFAGFPARTFQWDT